MSASFSPAGPLKGKLRPPGDKSISHRALLLACIAEGESEISGLSDGEDVRYTQKAIAKLGAEVAPISNTATPKVGLKIIGAALSKRGASSKAASLKLIKIYVGNSGTGIRLLAGICAGQSFDTRLDGDKSIRRRPMDRIVEPLSRMGAVIQSQQGHAPLLISGTKRTKLKGINYDLEIPSAQVKSAVLLAGLFAEGQTSITEHALTRVHTEEMLKDFGAEIGTELENGKHKVSLNPTPLKAAKFRVQADPSAAAFFAVAGCVIPNSHILLEDIYLGKARDGFIDVLKRMGADISIHKEENGAHCLEIGASQLTGVEVDDTEIPSLIDEIPILAVAAAHAQGTTRFSGIGELRYKESNRVETLRQSFLALGGDLQVEGETLVITGTGGLSGGEVNPMGDHRIAMAFAIAGLAAPPTTSIKIKNFKRSVSTSYPGFLKDLKKLQKSNGK